MIDREDDSVQSNPALFAEGQQTGGVQAPLPTYTYNQIASYLQTGFWPDFGRTPRKFNMGASGTGANNGVLHYTTDDLTAEGEYLAEQALAVYEAVLGIDFVMVSSTAADVDLFFDDNQPHAFADSELHAGTTTIDYSWVNVSTAYLNNNGVDIGTRSFETYLHEIGHALGLGHAGDYNGFSNYVTDTNDPNYGFNSNHYLNDSVQASMMSYFRPWETAVNADFDSLVTPMIADWIALGNMYGTGGAFLGDTVYGFNTNLTDNVYAWLESFAEYSAFTIIDSGGTDTLDFSLYTGSQRIDLNPGSASNVGGLMTGNMLIAQGTVIENAAGGSGADTILGNSVGNRLNGNGGDDTIGGKGGDDTLNGGEGGDKLYGDAGVDTLGGKDGDDVLDGGAGADKMFGDAGNDVYFVDTKTDLTHEIANAGSDTVCTLVDLTLAANIEALTLLAAGSARLGTGNALGNRITGNGFANTLRGLGGVDTIEGGQGADILIGGVGNDIFTCTAAGNSVPGTRDIVRAGDTALAFERAGAGVGDQFDFSKVDADTTKTGVQDFAFGALTGKGRLWALNAGNVTLVRGNTDGDAQWEFELAIEDGSVSASAYTWHDFLV